MTDPKTVVARSIQQALLNDEITWLDDKDYALVDDVWAKKDENDGVTRIEVVKLSALQTSIKVLPPTGAPRYFIVQVREQP